LLYADPARYSSSSVVTSAPSFTAPLPVGGWPWPAPPTPTGTNQGRGNRLSVGGPRGRGGRRLLRRHRIGRRRTARHENQADQQQAGSAGYELLASLHCPPPSSQNGHLPFPVTVDAPGVALVAVLARPAPNSRALFGVAHGPIAPERRVRAARKVLLLLGLVTGPERAALLADRTGSRQY
jgi:hypothetical protein